MNRSTKKIVFCASMAACAVILSYVEMLIPPIYPAVPGIKVGLPNIITVFLLYRFSLKEAATVSIIRILVACLLFGNFMTLIYSLCGAILSLTVMTLFKKIDFFSTVGVSIAGAVFHNLGQVLVAILIMRTAEIAYYMIALTISGTLAGIIIGLLGGLFIRYTKKLKI